LRIKGTIKIEIRVYDFNKGLLPKKNAFEKNLQLMKNISLITFFIMGINFQKSFSQEILNADISIDLDGKMIVKQYIEHYSRPDTLLLHKNIFLGKSNEETIIRKRNFYRKTFRQYKNGDGIVSYSVNPPKYSYDKYFLKDSVFFIAVNYLALSKRTFNKKKKFNLKINLPARMKLIYPQEENLVKHFYSVPAIIAGNFKEKNYKGYSVYNRSKANKNKRIEEIVSIIDKAFVYFEVVFSAREKRPDIIFLPFSDKLNGMNIDDFLILNENLLSSERINKKTLIHEVLHLWWSNNSVKFANPVFEEAITEFLTLSYLKNNNEFEYLTKILSFKLKKIRNIKSYNFNFDKVENMTMYKVYCYDLLPLLLWSADNKKNITQILIDFYRKNSNSYVTFSEGNNLMDRIGVPIKSN